MAEVEPRMLPTTGRIRIYTDETEVTEENVTKILSDAMFFHLKNAADETYLINYKHGIQPILDRVKPIRSDINNKVVENNASKIVDVHLGYDFANPLTFTQRAKTEADRKESAEKDDEGVSLLNKMMAKVRKAKKDLDLGEYLLTVGVGYQMVLPSRDNDFYSPFELMTLNPQTSFVVYSNDAYREPMLGVTYFVHEDGTYTYTAYSRKNIFRVDKGVGVGDFGNPVVLDNPLGMIPIVEFELTDRMGVFEKAIPILDAINLINSDRINDENQHVQSILWLHNCEIDTDTKKQLIDGDGVIMTRNNDGKQANIEYLSQTLDQSQIQTLVDYYQDQALQITSTPSWNENPGGSTSGAVMLSNGWQALELSAKVIEIQFYGAEMELLELVKRIVEKDSARDYIEPLKNLNPEDIEIKFPRNKTYDLTTKTTALTALLNAGVDGLTAFNTVSLFTDAQQAYMDSKKIIDGMQKKLIAEPNEPANNGNGSTNLIPGAGAAVDENGNGGINNKEKTDEQKTTAPAKVKNVQE